MKKILSILAVVALAATSSYAGCGKKVTVEGKLTYDADAKTLTVKGAKKPITLQAGTKITGKDGAKAKIEDLDGKRVEIVHEHEKADSVKIAAKKKKAA
ncbi:lipoprotein [Verrucomicrobiales bacterium]|jgi:hypothetical protein|nr:lipoprotein [Verrucomicrobiales bacterium]MDC0321877.1 lipoprotein [Verrucomicrobiales bacterium]